MGYFEILWRVEKIVEVMANNERVPLYELVERGALDNVFEGIADDGDSYPTCLEKLADLTDAAAQSLSRVARLLRGTANVLSPAEYPAPTGSFVPVIPIDEE
jgi:hypothetical protein